MHIGIEHIAMLETDNKAAEALRVGHAAHPDDADRAIRHAYDFLEDQHKATPQVGSVDIFGDAMTAEAWGVRVREINNAAVRVREIARIIGVSMPVNE